MKTIKINKKIIFVVRELVDSGKCYEKYSLKTPNDFISESIMLMAKKDDSCFCCPHHHACLAAIEIKKQKRALDGGIDLAWIKASNSSFSLAKRLAIGYGHIRNVVEQAVREHIVRPKECFSCETYIRMLQGIRMQK